MCRSRRLLCLVLVFCLLFSLTIGTAQASSIGAITTIYSAGGAMGAGTAVVSTYALPILAVLLAAGIVIYNLPALQDVLNNFFDALSPDAQSELQDISESGNESFALSAGTLAEIQALTNDYFYDADGSFKETGVSFDASNFIEYDYYKHDYLIAQPDYDLRRVVEQNFIHSLWMRDVAFSLFEGFHLTWTNRTKFLNNNYPCDAQSALSFINNKTGAKLIIASDSLSFLDLACSQFRMTAPVIEKVVDADGTRFILGFVFAKFCNNIVNTGTCENCTHWLETYHWQEPAKHEQLFMQFSDTGIASLDGVIFKDQGYKDGEWNLSNASTGALVSLGSSAITTVFGGSTTWKQEKDNTLSFPTTGTTMYIPTAGALGNANHLTSTGALTGTWDTTLEDSTSTDSGSNAGFWNLLWDWLSRILNALKSIPEAIWNAIDYLLSKIGDTLIGVATALFVPDPEFMHHFIADLDNNLEGNFGYLTYPISVIYDFVNTLLDLDETEPIIRWNDWKYQGQVVIPAGAYNLNDFLDSNQTFRDVHNIYLIAVDGYLIFLYIGYLYRKLTEIMKN